MDGPRVYCTTCDKMVPKRMSSRHLKGELPHVRSTERRAERTRCPKCYVWQSKYDIEKQVKTCTH